MTEKIQNEHDPIKYLENAKSILKNVPIEGDTYKDIKPVREAFASAYLAVLEAINSALTEKGIAKKELPRTLDGYRAALQKHLAIGNSRLLREFEKLYHALHIAGYYLGLLYDTEAVKAYMKSAEIFVNKLTKN